MALPADVQRRIRLTTDAGENSIREFSDHLRSTLPPDDHVLIILFEDEGVKRKDFGPKAHLIHTFAFLLALENMKVIESADELRQEIQDKRRNLARDLFERQAPDSPEETSWVDDYDSGANTIKI